MFHTPPLVTVTMTFLGHPLQFLGHPLQYTPPALRPFTAASELLLYVLKNVASSLPTPTDASKMTAIAVLLLTAVSPGHRPATVDGIIADTHARSAALRREMLADWTFPWQGAGYMASFSAAPVQAVVAAMFLNENATAVAAAQVRGKHARPRPVSASPGALDNRREASLAPHFRMSLILNSTCLLAIAQEALHNMSVPGPGRFNACYEWTVLARAFAMFNSRSGFNATARMRPETELALKEMVFSCKFGCIHLRPPPPAVPPNPPEGPCSSIHPFAAPGRCKAPPPPKPRCTYLGNRRN